RSRERLTINNLLRQTELPSDLAHLVFEKLPHRFHQLEVHFLRQTTAVVMSLDDLCWIASDRDALNHVRVKRSLSEKFEATVFAGLVLSILFKQFLGRVLDPFADLVAAH